MFLEQILLVLLRERAGLVLLGMLESVRPWFGERKRTVTLTCSLRITLDSCASSSLEGEGERLSWLLVFSMVATRWVGSLTEVPGGSRLSRTKRGRDWNDEGRETVTIYQDVRCIGSTASLRRGPRAR